MHQCLLAAVSVFAPGGRGQLGCAQRYQSVNICRIHFAKSGLGTEPPQQQSMVAAVRARGHRQVMPLDGPHQLAGIVRDLARPGDYVVFLGAGSITQWAYALPGELAALDRAA